jgi:hypothetical protein
MFETFAKLVGRGRRKEEQAAQPKRSVGECLIPIIGEIAKPYVQVPSLARPGGSHLGTSRFWLTQNLPHLEEGQGQRPACLSLIFLNKKSPPVPLLFKEPYRRALIVLHYHGCPSKPPPQRGDRWTCLAALFPFVYDVWAIENWAVWFHLV